MFATTVAAPVSLTASASPATDRAPVPPAAVIRKPTVPPAMYALLAKTPLRLTALLAVAKISVQSAKVQVL